MENDILAILDFLIYVVHKSGCQKSITAPPTDGPNIPARAYLAMQVTRELRVNRPCETGTFVCPVTLRKFTRKLA